MKFKFDTSTDEGKIAVMTHYTKGFDRILFHRPKSDPSWRELPCKPQWDWRECDYNYPADPPCKVLKPWTFETTPTGMFWVKRKDDAGYRSLVTFVGNSGLLAAAWSKTVSFDELLSGYQHSTDASLTWHPCGIETEESL